MADAPTPRLLTGINHLAVATDDMRSALEFYCGALGLPLGGLFWMHGVEGAVHAFIPFPDGRMFSLIQFAESRPRQAGMTYPDWAGGAMPAGTMQHVALQVDSAEDLDAARQRLKSRGVKVAGPIDHGFCTSIYFVGPDDVQMEITHPYRSLDDREFDSSAVQHCGIDDALLAALRAGDAGAAVTA